MNCPYYVRPGRQDQGLKMRNQGQSPESEQNILGDFPEPTLEQWHQEVERLLKGVPFAKKMFTNTLEGITVGAMYTEKDNADLPWHVSLPGQAPFLRGTCSVNGAGSWLVAQELPLSTAEAFNNALRADLQRGQGVTNLVLDQAGSQGLDPDQAPAGLIGAGGTSIASLQDLELAFNGVDLQEIPLFVQAGSSALPVLAMLLAWLEKQGKTPGKLQGCLGCDPEFELVKKGGLSWELDKIYDELAVVSRWAAANAPGLKTLPVFEDPWHNGGADSALSLALILASALEKLRALEQRGMEPAEAAEQIQFNLCLGLDFFLEIAKIRALRVLWCDLLKAAGCSEGAAGVKIHARTSKRTQTALDPHVNMLRVTTQAMSGVLGGVDSLHVSPFDELDSVPDEFSRRIARNVQLVLAHECHFDQVQDPAGGSWYVENLTAQLAEKSWTIFQEIEAAGGIVECLQSGWVQDRVAAVAEARKNRLATRRDVLVGTNKYPNSQEPSRQPRRPDHELLKKQRTEDLTCLRKERRPAAQGSVVELLKGITEAGEEQRLHLLKDAATEGVTLGEMVGALRPAPGPESTIVPIVLARDAEPFENLRQKVSGLAGQNQVFALCMGDVAGYMPRLDFVRDFFQAGGFAVLETGFFDNTESAVQAVEQSGAATVVLVGLDTTYSELAGQTARKLKKLPFLQRLVIAGGAPEHHEEMDFSINARSNILEVLGQLAADLGGQS